MIITGIVLLVAAAVAIGVAFVARRRWYAIVGTETLTCAELRLHLDTARGLGGAGSFSKACEVVGAAQPGPHGELTAELSHVPCVWYRYVIRRRHWRTTYDRSGSASRYQQIENVVDFASSSPFTLADATATVLVRPEGTTPDGAELVVDQFVLDESGVSLMVRGMTISAALSTVDPDTIGFEYEDWVLRPGTRLYVLGEATDRGGELEVVRPGTAHPADRHGRRRRGGCRRSGRAGDRARPLRCDLAGFGIESDVKSRKIGARERGWPAGQRPRSCAPRPPPPWPAHRSGRVRAVAVPSPSTRPAGPWNAADP